MDTLFSLRIFCQIVETGSFTQAADKLDISTSMVSKHLNALEKRLQTRLLNRNTRTVSLTEQGERYYQHCLHALAQLDEAESELSHHQNEPQGTLNIVAPLWFANPLFAELLTEYRKRYPKVQLQIELKNREQEQLSDADEIALRVATTLDENLIARKLCDIPFHFVASTPYLQSNAPILSLDDLAHHHGLLPSYTPLKGIRERYQIQPHQWFKQSTKSNNTLMLHQLALSGMGVAFLPDWVTLPTAKLQPLLPELAPYSLPLYAVYQNRTYLPPKVRSFIDFLKEKLAGKE